MSQTPPPTDLEPASPEATVPPAPSAPPGKASPFRHRDFRWLWIARAASTLAIQIQAAAIGWQVYEISRRSNGVAESAFYLSLVGLVQFLPLFALVLPAGEIADRRNRRTIMLACILVETLCAIGFTLMALHGAPPLWGLLALAALFGASRAFVAPAGQAFTPMIVPRESLPGAIVANSLAFQIGAIAGPALGGALAGWSVAGAYGASVALFVIAAITVLLIRTSGQPKVVNEGSRLALMREGLVYVWRQKIVFGSISLDLVAVLLGGATLLLPVFARDILHVGAEGFGVMKAGFAVGALLMALGLSRWPILKHGGRWMFGAVALFGVATVVFGLSRSFILTTLALAVAGAADMVSVNIRQTLIQIVTPDHMRGRVSSVSMLFIGASNELGEFESGLVARVIGPVGAAVFGGLGSLAAAGLWSIWFPELRKADKLT